MGKNPFQDIKFKWKDVEYTILSTEIMGAIETIEEVVTLKELCDSVNVTKNTQARIVNIKMARLARAYAALLNYAGVKDVTKEEVYSVMVKSGGHSIILESIFMLLMIMMPPSEHAETAKMMENSAGKVQDNWH